jgi:hypothetical protein
LADLISADLIVADLSSEAVIGFLSGAGLQVKRTAQVGEFRMLKNRTAA